MTDTVKDPAPAVPPEETATERRRRQQLEKARRRAETKSRRLRRWLRRFSWDQVRDQPIFTSTRQAECLDTALVATEPPIAGALAGVDDISGLPITADPHRLYRARIIGSPNVCILGGIDMGKALAVDTLIPTPTGWAHMGDLAPGDQVFDEQGQPTLVTAVSPIMHGRPCYDVEFSDGTVITADADHLWTTVPDRVRSARGKAEDRARRAGRSVVTAAPDLDQLTGSGWSGHGETMTTEQMRATVQHRGQANHAIPVAAPLTLPAADLSVDPYVLGCWLGDGDSQSAGLTSADPELLLYIEAAGYTVTPRAGRYRYGISLPSEPAPEPEVRPCAFCGTPMTCAYQHRRYCGHRCAAAARRAGLPPVPKGCCSVCGRELAATSTGRRCSRCWHAATLTGRLGVLELLGNKHIPPQYLRAGVTQRRALLAGLLDTDGTVSPQGTVQLCSTTQQLAADVYELACSLGYRATIRAGRARLAGRECGPKWTVGFTTADPVFRLTRKADALRERTRQAAPARTRYRYVVDVRPARSVPVRCIVVAAASQLFLAGRSMIPTHNSTTVKNQYVLRCWALGTRIAVFDRKIQQGTGNNGAGEYAKVAAALGGQWVRLDRRPGVGARINILDPVISVAGSEDTNVGQDELLLMVATAATGGPLVDTSDHAPHYALRCAHRAALRRAAAEDRVAILSDVIDALYRPDFHAIPGPVDAHGRKVVRELGLVDEATLVRWGLGLAINLSRFIEGDLSGLIDGESRDADGGPLNLSNPLLVIDTSGLSEGSPALGLVMAIMSTFIMARWARMPGDKTLVVEEAYNAERLVGVPAVFRAIAKRGRGIGASVVTVLHHLSDIDPESDLWALVRECELVHIFRQDKADDASQVIALYDLPAWVRETLMTLDRGVSILLRGKSLPPVLLRHQRTAFEESLNNTEAGMAGGEAPEPSPLAGAADVVASE